MNWVEDRYRVWPLFWDTYFSQFLYQIQKFITFLRMYKNLHVLSILKWYCNVVNYQNWPVCITFCDAGQIAKNTHSRIKFIAIFQSLFVRYVYKSLVFWIAQILSFPKWCRKRTYCKIGRLCEDFCSFHLNEIFLGRNWLKNLFFSLFNQS